MSTNSESVPSNKQQIENVQLSEGVLDRETQIRVGMCDETVQRYFDVMEDEKALGKFPPILLFRDSDGKLWLADGHHRVVAATRRKFESITAIIRPGTKADALWAAAEINSKNALPLSKSDLPKAIGMLVEAWPDRSNRAFADVLGCNEKTVRKYRPAKSGADESAPEKRTGKDGKSYSVKKVVPPQTDLQKPDLPPVPDTISAYDQRLIRWLPLTKAPEKGTQPGKTIFIPLGDSARFPSDNSDDFTSNNGEKNMSQKFDFDSLASAEKQTSLNDHTEYEKVLREIARDNCTRPESEILRLLERCGRDTKDLKTDVEWRVKRDTQIAEIKREQEYRDKNDELIAQLRAMRAEFEKLESDYNKKRHPIVWESDQLDDKVRKISDYRRELFDSCRDPNLELEMETLESSLDSRVDFNMSRDQTEIRCSITQLEHQMNNMPITKEYREQKDAFSREIKRLEEEYRRIEVKRNEFARKKSEQKTAIDALREKMIYS